MNLVNKISIGDFHSIEIWWSIGVPHVEKPTHEWFDYVTTTENVVCLVLKFNGEIKSYCQADIVGKSASISIVSNPNSLRQGFAAKLLKHLEKALKLRDVMTMEASVELGNHASHSLALKMALTQASSSNSEYGFTDYQKAL